MTTHIFYENRLVGQVKLDSEWNAAFEYDAEWLTAPDSFPLSTTLPLASKMHDGNIILPWLANLLPEGQQLAAVCRNLHISASDSLAILNEIGGDTAGAISIGEPASREKWGYTLLREHYDAANESDALEMHISDLGKRPFLLGENGVRISLAGGQKKTALAVLDAAGRPKVGLPSPGDQLAIPKNGAPSTIIIKPDNPDLPGIVENEAYCLCLAKLVGLEAVDCMITETTERRALVVARYDRQIDSTGSIERLHQEDFAQANGVLPWQKYETGILYGLSLDSILKTGRYFQLKESLKLLDQVIFNILIANTDAHAKNYSMMLSSERRIAPLYDVSSSLLWDHLNHYYAQKIANLELKPPGVARRHWEGIAAEAGLSAPGARQRVCEIADAIVKNRQAAIEIVRNQPGAVAETVNQVAALVERNAMTIAEQNS